MEVYLCLRLDDLVVYNDSKSTNKTTIGIEKSGILYQFGLNRQT